MALTPTAVYVRDNSSCAIWVGTASHTSGANNLSIQSTISGTLAIDMVLISGNGTTVGIITSGSGTVWTTSGTAVIASGTTVWAFGANTVGTVGWSAVAAWQASHTYAVGAIVRQTGVSCRINATVASNALSISSVGSGTVTSGQFLCYAGSTFTPPGTQIASGSGTSWTLTNGVNVGVATQMLGMLAHGNERVFICVAQTGNSGANEPAWSLGKGTTTTDNLVTWMECTGQPGLNGDLTNTPPWAASQTASLGHIIKNVAGTYLFACTSPGTTKSLPEPSWTLTAGVATGDNTATWMCLGPVGSFTGWMAPAAHLQTVANVSWLPTAVTNSTNYIYGSNDHNEQLINGTGFGNSPGNINAPTQIASVDPATVPPTTGTWSAGMTIYGVGNTGFTWAPQNNSQGMMIYGVTMYGGVGASSNGSFTFTGWGSAVLDKCVVGCLNTSSQSVGAFVVGTGNATGGGRLLFNDCSWRFGNIGDQVKFQGRVRVQNCATPIHASGQVPTTFIGTNYAQLSELEIVNSDFSALGANTLANGNGWVTMSNIKVASNTIISSVPGVPGVRIVAVNVDSGATNYQKYLYEYEGTLVAETAIVRTGGATVGTTAVSDKLVTTANTHWTTPLNSLPVVIWNATVGSSVTATVYGVLNGTALPTNDELWFEVEYPGSGASALGGTLSTTKANVMAAGSAWTADTSAWDSQAPARANSTFYGTVGAAVKSANNADRIFFVTATGTTTGSNAGFAGVVDGGPVTDGATFRAGMRFKMTGSFTPQIAGPVVIRVRAAKPSATNYIDWLAVLS